MTESHFSITSFIIFTISVQLNNCFQQFLCSISLKSRLWIELSKIDLSTSRSSCLLFGGSDSQCNVTMWSVASDSIIMLATVLMSFSTKVWNNILEQSEFTLPSSVKTNRQEFWGVFDNILDLLQFFFSQEILLLHTLWCKSFFLFRIENFAGGGNSYVFLGQVSIHLCRLLLLQNYRNYHHLKQYFLHLKSNLCR